MSSRGLTRENLLETLPVALRLDRSVVALADAMAGILSQRPEEIDRLRIYPDVFRLDEKLLDILAYDFKVDWWDSEYSLEEKRRVLRDNWNVHRTLGTKYAVETVLGDIFPGAWVEEWFEYGGSPYCFRLFLPVQEGGVSEDRQRRVLSRIWYYKNLRSHLEGISLEGEVSGTNHTGAYVTAAHTVEVWPELPVSVELTGAGSDQIGVAAVAAQTIEVWPALTEQAELTAGVGNDGFVSVQQTVELYPEERMDAKWRT